MWGVPVTHPAFTFRQPEELGPLQAHVEGFVRRLANGLPVEPELYYEGGDQQHRPTLAKLKWLLAECKRQKTALAFDIETGEYGLLTKYAKLRAFSVGAVVGHAGVGLSWFYPVTDPGVWRLFARALSDPKLPKVSANGYGYDSPVLRRYGVVVAGPHIDICADRRALSSTSYVGLEPQASYYLQCGPWKAEAKAVEAGVKSVITPNIPREKIGKYNAEDSVRTAQVRTHHIREWRELNEEDRKRVTRISKQLVRLSQAAAWLAHEGFPVDNTRRLKLKVELLQKFEERRVAFAKLTRERGEVRIGKKVSEADLRALFFREHARKGIHGFGLEIPFSKESRTDSGLASVDKRALLILWSQPNTPPEAKEIIKSYWQVNAPMKALAMHVDGEKYHDALGPDGRIHVSPNPFGTETYRWSCPGYNMFNIAEEQKEEEGSSRGDMPNLRSMFVAPPGYVIVHRDFRAFELEVMAEYTGDKALRHALDHCDHGNRFDPWWKALTCGCKKADVHQARTRAFFNLPAPMPVPHMIRRQGKVVGLQSQYGAGVESVAIGVWDRMPDVPFDAIAALHARFPEVHFGIAEHWQRSVEFAEINGYNEAPIMFYRRYYPPYMPLKPTETSNYAIQAGAAAIANSALVGRDELDFKRSIVYKLKRYWPRAWFAMHAYDSFDILAPEKDAQAIDGMMTERMAGPWRIGARDHTFPSDGKIAERWSEV